MIVDLVTDRTIFDVQAQNAKGQYNASDYNRVEIATEHISNLLTSNGYPVTITVQKDWQPNKTYWSERTDRYLNNILLCKNNFCSKPGVQLPEHMDGIDYISANAIEQFLSDSEKLINNMKEVLRYSGTFYCGSLDGLRGYCL